MKTFVVRLAELEPAPGRGRPSAAGTLRGVVDEVATGDRTPFRTTEELIALLETGLGSGSRPAVPGRAERGD